MITNRVTFVRGLTISGLLILAGYVLLFSLLQAPVLWYNLRPDPIRSLFPDVFHHINLLYAEWWVNLQRTDPAALWVIPVYLLVLLLITAPLLLLLRAASRPGALAHVTAPSVLLRVFVFTALIMVVLLFLRGLLTSDVYSYSWYARIWTVHGASPFTHPPIEFPPDPEGAFYWVGWQEEPTVYGPVWLLISSACLKLSTLIGGTFSAQLLTLRLLTSAAHILNAVLVWLIAGQMLSARDNRPDPRPSAVRPRPAALARRRPRLRLLHAPVPNGDTKLAWQTSALLFYVWNPLLVIEFMGSGHNDVVMLTFVLLAFWLFVRGWWRIAALAFALAALVKLPAFIFLPGFLWLLLWQNNTTRRPRTQPLLASLAPGIWRAAQAAAIVLFTWAALYAPFWEGLRTLKPLFSGPANRLFLHSLPYDLWWNLPDIASNLLKTDNPAQFIDSFRAFLSAALRPAFLLVAGIIAILLTWRARTFSRALIAWSYVLLVVIMAQGWFWPWYLSWCIVPAALAISRRLRTAMMILSVSALLLYIEEQVLSTRIRFFLDWSGILIFGPALLYLLGSWLADRLRPRIATPSATCDTLPAVKTRASA